jgi:hypothetical protein
MSVLPEKFFTKAESVLEDSELSLDNNSSLFNSLNNGTVDVSKLVEETPNLELTDTISAPKITVQPKTETKPEQQNEPAKQPSEEDSKRLDGIEQSLVKLDKQIKVITDSLNKQPQNTAGINTVNDANVSIPEKNKPKKDKNSIIEVVKKDKIINNNNVVNSKEFNTERLNELVATRNSLMQERQKILQSVYFTNEGSNKNIFNETTKENIINKTLAGEKNNNVNNSNTAFNVSNNENNTTQNSTNPEYTNKVSNNTKNENVSNFTKNEYSNNIVNTKNESAGEDTTPAASSTGNTPAENTTNTSSQTNINNNYNTVNEQNLPGDELSKNINVRGQNNLNDLPSPTSEISENTGNVIAVLNQIKEGINKLNDGMGGNFQKLGTSIEGIKNNVINNNTVNNNTAGAQPNTQVGSAERTPMPDYRSDLPNSGDFPPKFDLSTLGGTNLPNPQFIM